MWQAVHLTSKNFPGYGPSEGRCLPYAGVSGRFVAISPCSSYGDYRIYSQVKIVSMKCTSRPMSFVCKANAGGHRRNPDFSRQNRQGFSRNRKKQNEETDSFESFDDSDLLASKNGPLLSLSGTPKSQATAAPGRREKEIVELFKKVQAQLRERAAAKEDKKVESAQGKGRDSETVDSLLKLLRKHSNEQDKKKTNSPSSQESSLEQSQQDGPYNEAKSENFFNSNKEKRNDVLEPNATTLRRPPSSFRRKSPTPQVKFQSKYQSEDPVNSTSHMNASSEKKKDFEGEIVDEGGDKQQQIEQDDLGSLKLTELRALAKSRGVKGFSKMKKCELLELLSGSST